MSMMSSSLGMVILQAIDNSEPSREFYIFFIASEIVVTAIAFIGAYLIFRNLFKKKDQEEKDKGKQNM